MSGSEEWYSFPLVQVWMLPFYAETIIWDDSNLTLFPSRDPLQRSSTSLLIRIIVLTFGAFVDASLLECMTYPNQTFLCVHSVFIPHHPREGKPKAL